PPARGALRPGAVLVRRDLVGADLRAARLARADLRGALLIGTDLRDADLRDADLIGADLRAADLRGADLTGGLFLTRGQLQWRWAMPRRGSRTGLRGPRTGGQRGRKSSSS